jgi:hypothetical protein
VGGGEVSRTDGIAYLWFGGKDGWQVTSFDPREDAAIGFPRNGDVRLYITHSAYDQLRAENADLKDLLKEGLTIIQNAASGTFLEEDLEITPGSFMDRVKKILK